jgi:hypothetical protein
VSGGSIFYAMTDHIVSFRGTRLGQARRKFNPTLTSSLNIVTVAQERRSMKVCASFVSFFIIISSLGLFDPVSAFLSRILRGKSDKLEIIPRMATLETGSNICDLPGDPSLILTTNVNLGDKKLEIMKGGQWNRHVRFVHVGLSISFTGKPIDRNFIFFSPTHSLLQSH